MITLAKHFTFAGGTGNILQTDWVRVPEEFQNWQLATHIHSAISGTTGTVQLETTWDTSESSTLGSSVNLSPPTLSSQDINSGVGPMVRLVFTAASDCAVVVSVFLTPKSE